MMTGCDHNDCNYGLFGVDSNNGNCNRDVVGEISKIKRLH